MTEMPKFPSWCVPFAGLLLAPISEAGATELHAHDEHHRPAPYNDPDLTVPPHSGADAEYPRAVGFTPAHSSNFTAGGINSYDFVVVHTMQGYYAGSISWFQNPDANVSAHYCMRAEDGEITQMVRNSDRAWHVGNSNSQAIGIEHEGFIDDTTWYTWVNYVESARLARWLCETYDIPVDRDHIVGHVELPSQSHTDPGPNWNWTLYMDLITDVVDEGNVEVIAVDADAPCTLTAIEDTWLKGTGQPSSELDDGDLCAISAGDTLAVNYEYAAIDTHRRVLVDVDHPCAETFADRPAFAFEGHFEGTCENPVLAGVEVALDGGTPQATDAEGLALFADVGEGMHDAATVSDTFEVVSSAFAHDRYPGSRVVLVTRALGGSDETGEPPPGTTTGPDEADSSSGVGGVGTGDSDEPDPVDTETGGADSGRSLPQDFGESDGGCSCQSSSPTSGSGLVWSAGLLLLLGRVRRRRISAA